MRFLKADNLFNGDQFLPQTTVLVLENNGTLRDIISESETDSLNIEKLEGVITPGFVNVHCHLELSHLKSVIPTHTGLVEFAKQIIIRRHKASKDEIIEHQLIADKSMKELGIVAVGDICNTIDSFKVKEQSSIYYHNFIELLGLNPSNAETNFEKGLLLLEELEKLGLHGSLAPHAPYSTSIDLISKIADYNILKNKTGTIHNQESEEETKFFSGEQSDFEKLFDFLNLDISWFRAPKTSSLKNYFASLKNQKTILVHNTVSKKEDIQLANNSTVFWCFCPNANLYIENKLPNYEFFKELQNYICIGTDSLASNWKLDLISEVNVLLNNSTEYNLQAVLKFITKNGAKALAIDSNFGSFIKGKNAGLNLLEVASTVSGKSKNKLKFIKKIA
ncbi:MAG: amidohydrolase family protein [Bacteroidota bacterium]|nr:amidohydrolase family protein [Bacteroidota bacterium]